MEYYNGKKESVQRHYNSLRAFVGENRLFPCGDVLCISVKNNGDYSKLLVADGKRRFIDLYNNAPAPGSVPPDSVGTGEIIDGSIRMEDLSEEVRNGLDEMNHISLTDEDMEKWFDDEPDNDDPEVE